MIQPPIACRPIGCLALALLSGCVIGPRASADDASAPPPLDGPLDDADAGEGAAILVEPVEIDFGAVLPGETAERDVVITNAGTTRLRIEELVVFGSPDFSVRVDGVDPADAPQVLADPDADGAPGLAPGSSMTAHLTYAPLVNGPDGGRLEVRSSDPDRPTVAVALVGNDTRPCIQVSPSQLDFGAVPLGRESLRVVTLRSCGSAPVEVTRVSLAEDSAPTFSFAAPGELGVLPPMRAGEPLPETTVTMRFAPDERAASAGTLQIGSTDPERPQIVIPMTGRGVANDCPIAAVAEAEVTTRPLEVIALDGSPSTDVDGPDGRPIRYTWSVLASPDGSTAVPVERFQDPRRPRDTGVPDDPMTPTAVFFADVVGTYVIALTVTDNLDHSAPSVACPQPAAQITIEARPTEDLYIELTWQTPADPDQTDADGTDLDLRLRHPLADDWYGDLVCFYANANPDWGDVGPDGNPALQLDDNNGAGPEVITLDGPEATAPLGGPYQVGVHYYRGFNPADEFWGPTDATVRVFVQGERAGTWSRLIENQLDLWIAVGITWGEGAPTVEAIDRIHVPDSP